jgi:hypothetical protein
LQQIININKLNYNLPLLWQWEVIEGLHAVITPWIFISEKQIWGICGEQIEKNRLRSRMVIIGIAEIDSTTSMRMIT